MIDGIVWKQKKRKRRLAAQAEEDRKKRRVGRRQERVECMRALKITERGRIVKARTPSGRKQRALAMESATVEAGRQAASKQMADKKFEKRLEALPQVDVHVMRREQLEGLRNMAIFHRGSVDHKVKLPSVDEGKAVKRQVFEPSERREGMWNDNSGQCPWSETQRS